MEMELVVYPSLFDGVDEKPFKCTMEGCKYSGKTEENFYMHFQRIHDSEVISCPDCSFTTTAPYELKRHSKRHSEEERFKCEFCEKVYISDRNLKHHISKVHYEAEANSKKFTCSICDFESLWSRDIVDHMASHGFGKYYCRFCDVACSKLSKFRRHKATKRHLKKRMEQGFDPISSEDEEKKKEPDVVDFKFKVVKKDRKPKFIVLEPRKTKPVATIKTPKRYVKKKKTLELEDLYDEATLEEACRITIEPSTLCHLSDYVRERWKLMQTQRLEGDEVEDVLFECELCGFETEDVWDFLEHLRRLIPEPQMPLHQKLYFSPDFNQSSALFDLKPPKLELKPGVTLPAKAVQNSSTEAEHKPEELSGAKLLLREPSKKKSKRESSLQIIEPKQMQSLPAKTLQINSTEAEVKPEETSGAELQPKESPKRRRKRESSLPESDEPKRKMPKIISKTFQQSSKPKAENKIPISQNDQDNEKELLKFDQEAEAIPNDLISEKEEYVNTNNDMCPSPGLGSEASSEMSFGAYSGVSPIRELETEDESLPTESQQNESTGAEVQSALESTMRHHSKSEESLGAEAEAESEQSMATEANSEDSISSRENIEAPVNEDHDEPEHSLNAEPEPEQHQEPDPDKPLVIDYNSDDSIERDLNDLPSDFEF